MWKTRKESSIGRRVAAAIGGLLFAFAAAAAPRGIEGQVTRVVDGDSLWLTPAAGPPVELRLLGIDAPEGCQAGGPEARRALEDMVLRRTVSVRSEGRDDFGRTLGTVMLDGVNVNQRMVEEGQAWSYRFKWDQGPYVKQERMAQALQRGVFASAGAVMPRDFRRSHGPCQAGDAPGVPAAGATTPAPLPSRSPPPLPAAAPRQATTPAAPPAAAPQRCDGRTYCSQMTSCAEATWFLKNCPGVKMDGNHDGVPCEQQWCR
jgi:endonuclease YncB( thermonuclease family)